MKRLTILIIVTIFVFIFPRNGQATPSVSAHNAVLIEQSTGRILFEKQAHEPRPVASITKIMTAIIAIESGKMDEFARTSRRAIYTEGSSIYLEQGEKMSIEDLVYGLMLRSGNDAAVVIAEHIGGSVEGFVHLMNEKASWLGMTNTHFENPHGLHSDDHYSTAYDMAILMRYAMDHHLFREISETVSYQAKGRSYAWRNKNKLLTSLYDVCTGGKTGFTKKAGRTLVTSANKNDMDLIAVTLNAPDDWNDHISMYEWGFNNYYMHPLLKDGKNIYQIKETNQRITGYIYEQVYFPLTKVEQDKIIKKSYLHETKDDGQVQEMIGKTVIYLESQPIMEVPIFTKEQKQTKSSIFSDILLIYKKVIGLNG